MVLDTIGLLSVQAAKLYGPFLLYVGAKLQKLY